MMTDPRLIGGGGFRGADVHAAVDLHRIDGYHFALEQQRQFGGNSGFAAGAGANHGDDAGVAVVANV